LQDYGLLYPGVERPETGKAEGSGFLCSLLALRATSCQKRWSSPVPQEETCARVMGQAVSVHNMHCARARRLDVTAGCLPAAEDPRGARQCTREAWIAKPSPQGSTSTTNTNTNTNTNMQASATSVTLPVTPAATQLSAGGRTNVASRSKSCLCYPKSSTARQPLSHPRPSFRQPI
jgi:hypothetical protein